MHVNDRILFAFNKVSCNFKVNVKIEWWDFIFLFLFLVSNIYVLDSNEHGQRIWLKLVDVIFFNIL